MTLGYIRLVTIGVVAGLLSVGSNQRAVELYQAPQHADRFPVGTALVVYDAVHGRTYFTTEAGCDSVSFSADGKRLILRSAFDSYVFQAATLRLLRHLSYSHAWWERSCLGYFDQRNDHILSGGRKVRASTGRRELLAADPTGRFFLAERLIRPGTVENGNTPTYQFQLQEKTSRGSLECSRDLATATYDPGSQGIPQRLAVLSRSVVVFGFPRGIVDAEDFVGALHGSQVTAPLKDGQGRSLQFLRSPVVADNAIVGLAEAVVPGRVDVLAGNRFLYRVTAAGIALRPVAPNVVFVTYDPERKAMGLGVSDKDGISVKFGEQ
jgi:hypothetical protein